MQQITLVGLPSCVRKIFGQGALQNISTTTQWTQSQKTMTKINLVQYANIWFLFLHVCVCVCACVQAPPCVSRCLYDHERWSHEMKANMPSGALRQKNESMMLSMNGLRGHVGCCSPFTVLLKTTNAQCCDVHAKCKHVLHMYVRIVTATSVGLRVLWTSKIGMSGYHVPVVIFDINTYYVVKYSMQE